MRMLLEVVEAHCLNSRFWVVAIDQMYQVHCEKENLLSSVILVRLRSTITCISAKCRLLHLLGKHCTGFDVTRHPVPLGHTLVYFRANLHCWQSTCHQPEHMTWPRCQGDFTENIQIIAKMNMRSCWENNSYGLSRWDVKIQIHKVIDRKIKKTGLKQLLRLLCCINMGRAGFFTRHLIPRKRYTSLKS